jgi:hypothetical protein
MLATTGTAMFERTVYLVSCVSQKKGFPAPARDLYVSEWFRRACRYVEATGDPWFILSAEYGLISPDQLLAPYERTLNRMGVVERRAWAARVRQQMTESLPRVDRIVVLAGQRYREFLMDDLRRRAAKVEVPLSGLIGEQLSWFGRQAAHESPG